MRPAFVACINLNRRLWVSRDSLAELLAPKPFVAMGSRWRLGLRTLQADPLGYPSTDGDEGRRPMPQRSFTL